MSFHLTAQSISVHDGHTLRAQLHDSDGNAVDAHFDLDTCIGNNDGHFEWGGENFSHSASDISFSIEGGASVPILRATLKTVSGDEVPRDINLAERISNENGRFVFQ